VLVVSRENDRTMQANRKHDGEHAAMGAAHGGHTEGVFRDRFWVCLAVSGPVVLYTEMVQTWLGSSTPQFPGSGWVVPVLGTFIFVWGGWPFLKGAFE
jgi:Cu2+-exporting ATPase